MENLCSGTACAHCHQCSQTPLSGVSDRGVRFVNVSITGRFCTDDSCSGREAIAKHVKCSAVVAVLQPHKNDVYKSDQKAALAKEIYSGTAEIRCQYISSLSVTDGEMQHTFEHCK